MANPTGGNLTENTGYTWADGDVYSIAQTDTVEGAATGASFSGLGVDNEPHQVLLNKIKLTHTKQVTDEANISVLQAFAAGFAGSIQPNGYVKLNINDATRGATEFIVQWGSFSLIGQTASAIQNAAWQQTFPTPFAAACYGLIPYWQWLLPASGQPGYLGFVGGVYVLEALLPLNKTYAQFFTDWDNLAAVHVAQSTTDGGLQGIGWVAWGI